MKRLLADIQSGAFADEWMAENEAGKTRFKQLESDAEDHQIEEVGHQLRGMMPFAKNRLIDKAKN